ncbi:MAG: hypothetical protein COB25_001815, partial [Oceanospirillales bacterium]|nr:hypothetical protein [Oceanospirillales bacterium]
MKAVNHFIQGVVAIVLWCCFSLASAEVITQNRTVEADDLSLDNQGVVVDGATLTINGTHRFASLELKNGATLTHSVEVEAKLDLFIEGVLHVDSSSSVNANAKGKPRPSAAHSYVGGSYGGRGGFYGSNQSDEEFGSYTSPTDYGVGGSAGRGGGAVKLTAGEMKLDGRIQADGSSVTSGGGAGSGGSVWLSANTLSGAGAISASGGNGRSGNYGGGGGGG